LVAEDNPTNQKIICQFLESAGYSVVLASDGEEALDLYETENPDIAILDFNMPQRTGIEVIQAIRVMERPGTRMPALILSASVTVEARERAANAGADEFLGKPFEATALIQLIDRLGAGTVRGTVARPPATNLARHQLTVVGGWSSDSRVRRPSDSRHDLVDKDRLTQLEDIARNSSFMGELIAGFQSDVEDILRKAQNAVARGDLGALPDLMHSLKGAAVGVGAIRLASLAPDLEKPVGDMVSMNVVAHLDAIGKCFEATSAFLNDYVRSHQQLH
jgi:two-component system sensor histidine kinase RpfC